MQTTKNQNMAGTNVQTSKVWKFPIFPDLARFGGETSFKVGLSIWEFCAISRRLISKIRFPHPILVADAICGTRFDLRDSKRRALEN